MFPIPFSKYIPKSFREGDSKTALSNKADANLTSLLNNIKGLSTLMVPERCPDYLLNELGVLVAAPILPNDTTLTKRKKIYEAVRGYKNRGTWLLDVKPRIDSITGFSASIYSNRDLNYWIEINEAVPYVWAAEADGSTTLGGLVEIATGTEFIFPGNIYIDLGDGGTLPADTLAKLVAEIKTDLLPAYMIIYLGYTITGNFYLYEVI